MMNKQLIQDGNEISSYFSFLEYINQIKTATVTKINIWNGKKLIQ